MPTSYRAYSFPAGGVANQPGFAMVGGVCTVNQPITITALDAFVSSGGNWTQPKTVTIYNRADQSVLATVTIQPTDVANGFATQVGQNVSKPITAVAVAAGISFEFAASDWRTDNFRNATPTVDTGGGAITFNGEVYSSTSTGYSGTIQTPTPSYQSASFVFSPQATFTSISPTTGNAGTSVVVTARGSGTAWTSGTTFSATGGTGASISGLSINVSTQVATFTLYPGTTAATLTIGNSTESSTATFTAGAAAALSIGALSVSANTTAGITVAWSAAPGGTGLGRSYALYRNASAPFTPPGSGTLVGTTSGLSLLDPSPGSGVVYYRVIVTDSASSTVTSAQSATQGAFPARENLSRWVLGFVGDSITAGTGASSSATYAATVCTNLLAEAYPLRAVTSNNYGYGGTTSADWLPGAGHLSAAGMAGAGVTHCLVQLGTNDASTANAVSAATYLSNMASIAQNIAAAGIIVYLDAPPYVVPANGWDEAANVRIVAYRDALATIANGTTIKLGETFAPEYFARNPSQLGDGIHPNDAGHAALGAMWAAGVISANGATTTSGGFRSISLNGGF